MSRVATAAVLVALAGVSWGVLHVGWYSQRQLTDYPVYQTFGDAMAKQHLVPYRDFKPEYPPGALPVFILPALVHSNYATAFQVLMFVCLAVLVLAVAAAAGTIPAAFAALAPLALGPVVLSRFDLWPAALAVIAVVALVRNRRTTSAVVLGSAFAAKLWPAVLVPVALIWIAHEHGRAAAARWLAEGTATAALWFLPFVALSPGGVGYSFHLELARPLQIESLGAAILLTLHRVTSTTVQMVPGYGSQNLSGSGVHEVQVATTVLEIVALLVVWALFARGPMTIERLFLAFAASVAALLAFGKVFSPQFMIWLIPFVAILRGVRRASAWLLTYAAFILTQTWFPRHYWDLAHGFATTQTSELLARDLCVVVLFLVLAWPLLGHQAFAEHRARLEALQRVQAQLD